MSKAIEQQLIDNISAILKRSLAADATINDLRSKEKAAFKAIFPENSGFKCKADTFQPYVQEVADDLLSWQADKNQITLIKLVKKIEKLFLVLTNFEQAISQ